MCETGVATQVEGKSACKFSLVRQAAHERRGMPDIKHKSPLGRLNWAERLIEV
jgi:hypothetical protein